MFNDYLDLQGVLMSLIVAVIKVMHNIFYPSNFYKRQLLVLMSILLLTVTHFVRAEESKTEPPLWLINGFVASLEDNRSGT